MIRNCVGSGQCTTVATLFDHGSTSRLYLLLCFYAKNNKFNTIIKFFFAKIINESTVLTNSSSSHVSSLTASRIFQVEMKKKNIFYCFDILKKFKQTDFFEPFTSIVAFTIVGTCFLFTKK